MKRFFLICVSAFLLTTSAVATPLIDAVLKNDIDKVATLLKKGVDKNRKDKNGFCALDYAVSRKYSEIAQILYSDNLNNFIFLRQDGKPLHVEFSRSGFKFANPDIDKQIVVLGTITPESYQEVCDSYYRAKKDGIHPKEKKFHLFLVASRESSLKELNKIRGKCKKFSTFLYPNYKFYQLLERLFKYQGVPQFLFRDKNGKLTGGSIESYIFEGDNGFTRLMK
jgi:hypothetical protein